MEFSGATIARTPRTRRTTPAAKVIHPLKPIAGAIAPPVPASLMLWFSTETAGEAGWGVIALDAALVRRDANPREGVVALLDDGVTDLLDQLLFARAEVGRIFHAIQKIEEAFPVDFSRDVFEGGHETNDVAVYDGGPEADREPTTDAIGHFETRHDRSGTVGLEGLRHPRAIKGERGAVETYGAAFKLGSVRAQQYLTWATEKGFGRAVAIDDHAIRVTKDHAGANIVEEFGRDSEFLLRTQAGTVYEELRHR